MSVQFFMSGRDHVPDQESDDSLDDLGDVARDEREYIRHRLSKELGREPSNDEIDEWMREHTEGF